MKLENLSIGYKQAVVSGINTELMPGQFVCLIGRNGTGKSTLLKTLSRLQQPISGRVQIEGKALTDFSSAELAKTIGLVLTQMPDLANTTLRELVAYGRLPYSSWLGALKEEDWAEADRAIEQLGIAHLSGRKICDLSDGERQKGMIARTLAQGTQYLLLDEPSAFLDYESKQELMTLLIRLAHDNHKGVLLSTHDLELAHRHADLLWKIQDGHLHCIENGNK